MGLAAWDVVTLIVVLGVVVFGLATYGPGGWLRRRVVKDHSTRARTRLRRNKAR